MKIFAGILVKAAQAIKDHGALDFLARATHSVLSGGAVDRINPSVVCSFRTIRRHGNHGIAVIERHDAEGPR
jgi:phosphoribosylpyrophosphate synthetase